MEFRCRLGTPGGGILEAVYAAENEASLRRDLEEQGLVVLSMRPAGVLGRLAPAFARRRRIKRRIFLEFNQQLATLVRSGMPLVQSLDLLRRGLPDPVFRSVLDAVHERVKSGAQLSEAFAEHGDLIPRVYVASLMAGERSGSLEAVLRRYVAYERLLGSVRRKTISALIYPAILLALALTVVGIIVLKLVPAFADFYTSFDAELPALTRAIMALSTWVRTSLPLLLAGGVALAIVIAGLLRQPAQRLRLDRALLTLPWAGGLVQKFAVTQMARTLSTLLGGGIPLVQALEVASGSVGNRFIARELAASAQRVREGQSLSATMQERGVFPDVAVKMTEVGESTGALQDMLNSVADFYDEDLETTLERFVTVIEPLLLVVLGIVIASLLLALYLPLIQLSSVVQ